MFRIVLHSLQNGDDAESSHIYSELPSGPWLSSTSIAFHIISIHQQSGTWVKTDEPTLICYHHLKSTVYIAVYSLYCTFYGFRQMYTNMYPSLYYHKERVFHCSKNTPLIHSHLPNNWQKLSLYCFHSLPFAECYIT